MFSRKKIALAVMLAAFSGGASAAGTAEQIKSINEDVALLSARLAEMEMKAKIAGKQQEIDRLGAAGSGMDAQRDLPVVRSIEGVDGKLQAVLATGGGGTQAVIKGDKFGEWTVNKIDVNAVFISRGKQTVRLGFGTEPQANSSPSQGGVPTPGFTPGMR